MEIKINKEVRQHRETLFFGLSARQFFCSVLAVGMAVGVAQIPISLQQAPHVSI